VSVGTTCELPPGSRGEGCTSSKNGGRGGIRTPGRRCRRQRFSRPPHSTALPPFQRVLRRGLDRCYDDGARRGAGHAPTANPPTASQALHWLTDLRRGGRVAEGTRLLSEYGDQTPSRVRIPPSPSPGDFRSFVALWRLSRKGMRWLGGGRFLTGVWVLVLAVSGPLVWCRWGIWLSVVLRRLGGRCLPSRA
jgi:hypothetical protein